jgi:hypothetical protein
MAMAVAMAMAVEMAVAMAMAVEMPTSQGGSQWLMMGCTLFALPAVRYGCSVGEVGQRGTGQHHPTAGGVGCGVGVNTGCQSDHSVCRRGLEAGVPETESVRNSNYLTGEAQEYSQ